jgi:GDPmannose 4,6-dehydratase
VSQKKKALIFGITGQDGSYLAEFLLSKNYEVHGVIRRTSSFNTSRIDHLISDRDGRQPQIQLHHGDVLDGARINALIKNLRPDEIYHLAAQSHVRVSFDEPELTSEVVMLGTLRVLEAVRLNSPESKVYIASSSEMFGSTPPIQSELSAFQPSSPYAAAKLASYWNAKNYRDGYGLYVSNGILFNHESPRRGRTFVTKKIVDAAVSIKLGNQSELRLGNLDAIRDWGYAPEYVQGMWAMLQIDNPDDFVLATGRSVSVCDFLGFVFDELDLDWREFVVQDSKYFRPVEVSNLQGDSAKAYELLNWKPRVNVEELAMIMVMEEFRRKQDSAFSAIDAPVFSALGSP